MKRGKRRKVLVSAYVIAICLVFTLDSADFQEFSELKRQANQKITKIEKKLREKTRKEKTNIYLEVLKGSYQGTKGSLNLDPSKRFLYLNQSFQTFKKLFKKYNPSIYAYEGFIRTLADAGRFDIITQLADTKGAELEKAFNDNIEIKLIFAQSALYTGRQKMAEQLFLQLNEDYPNDSQVAYYTAVSFVKNNKLEKALDYLKQCLENKNLKQKHFLFYFLESKIYMQQKEYPFALQAIEDSLKLYPRFDKGWLFKAILTEQLGLVNEAIKGYKHYLHIIGKDSEIEKQLVQLLFSQQRFNEAAQHMKKIKSDRPDYYFDLALIQLRGGKPKQALKHVNKALKKAKHFAKAKLLKVDILLALKKKKKALNFVKKWLYKRPENLSVIHTLLLLRQAKIPVKKIIQVLETVKKKKATVGILATLGDLYLEQNKYDKCIKNYKQIVMLSQDTALQSKIFFQMGYIYFVTKQFDKIEEPLKKAIDSPNPHPSAYNLLAYHYAQQEKNLELALKLVNKALRMVPSCYYYLDTKGYILLKLGRRAESIKLLEEAQRLAPHDGEISKHLAQARALENKADEESEEPLR